MEILEKIYTVYGDNLPVGTSEYSAVEASPVTVLDLKKAFKTYENFKLEYTKFCMAKRAEAAKAVVQKPLNTEVKKNAK